MDEFPSFIVDFLNCYIIVIYFQAKWDIQGVALLVPQPQRVSMAKQGLEPRPPKSYSVTLTTTPRHMVWGTPKLV